MRLRLPARSFRDPSARGRIRASAVLPFVVQAAVLAMLPGRARAQSEAVLAKDDAVFARALYRGGWTDLAESLCKTIEKGGKISPEAAVGVKALHLDLRFDIALKEPDVIKRKDMIKAVLDEKEDFVHQYANTKEATETSEQLLARLQDWCRRAEASGIAPLEQFSLKLKRYA